jgi:hypothetical protein
VKALPRPSSSYSETVCCAGTTATGQWKRLYPIRYRHTGEEFTRWDRISFDYVSNNQDRRAESCKVIQGTIKVTGKTTGDQKRQILEPLITPSAKAAYDLGRSLTAVRPFNVRFSYRLKPTAVMLQERQAYKAAARQSDFLDRELEAFEPTPYMLGFTFHDEEGVHTHQSGDWETHTTFRKWSKDYGERSALEKMKIKFEQEYQEKGMVFVLGTLAKRPKQWTLLGVVRLNTGSYQLGFPV